MSLAIDPSDTSGPAEAPAPVRPVRTQSRLIRDRLIVVVVVLAFWEIAGRTFIDPLWLSRPGLVIERLYAMALSGEALKHLGRTSAEAGLGLALAFLVIPLGLAMARFKYATSVMSLSSWSSTACPASLWRRCSSSGSASICFQR